MAMLEMLEIRSTKTVSLGHSVNRCSEAVCCLEYLHIKTVWELL